MLRSQFPNTPTRISYMPKQPQHDIGHHKGPCFSCSRVAVFQLYQPSPLLLVEALADLSSEMFALGRAPTKNSSCSRASELERPYVSLHIYIYICVCIYISMHLHSRIYICIFRYLIYTYLTHTTCITHITSTYTYTYTCTYTNTNTYT